MTNRRLWTAITVIVALAAAGYLLFRPDPEATSQTVPACQLLTPPSVPPAGESSGIRIVEQGFSRVGPFGSAKASMGVLLRNDTGKVAYRTLVTLDAVDSTERTVIDERYGLFLTQVVPIILPGASVAVGSARLLDELTQRQGKEIASIAVTVQVSQWLEPGDDNNGLGRITATVVPGSGQRKASGQGQLTYDVESTNCTRLVPRGVSLAFRDGSGAIVGGSMEQLEALDTCRPGLNAGRQAVMGESDIPAQADLDRTSITVYCDFDRPRIPLTSGAPYN